MAEGSQFLSFRGIRVHYHVHLPEAPLTNRVLLLGSPLMTTFNWRKLLPELDQMGCLTVTCDLPGFGKSLSEADVPQGHEIRASILWGILDEVDRETGSPMSMWHLAGHGTACATLLRMLNQAPDSVKTQMFISPLLMLDPPVRGVKSLQAQFDEVVSSKERFQAFMDAWSVQKLDDYVLDRMRKPLLQRGVRTNFARMVAHAHAEAGDDMGFCPTMVVYGNKDPLMDEKQLTAVRARLPDAEVHTLKSAGHYPMETHSKALRDYMRGWIRYNDT